MIVSTLIFFEANFHEKIIKFVSNIFKISSEKLQKIQYYPNTNKIILSVVGIFLLMQLLMPWRYLLYKGELFWTEEGYRFSWRVMLMEKAGSTNFKIVDGKTKSSFYVDNTEFLTSFQEKQMSFQPDFILEYAHYLGDYYTKKGIENVEVYADSYVALNGRLSSQFINPKVDLYQQKESFKPKKWIIPFTNEIKIKGL